MKCCLYGLYVNLYITHDHIRLYVNLYITHDHIRLHMLRIAGQTAGPIGLKFFVDTWVAGGSPRLKKSKIFFF